MKWESFRSAGLVAVGIALAARPALAESPVASGMKAGQEAFAAGNMEQARDAFVTVLQADPKNKEAACDLGIVYLRLDDVTKATKLLESAAGGAKSPDRALVMALVFEHVAGKTPMQGAKPLLAYLDAHRTATDEPAVNALGIALAQAESMGIKSGLYTDARKSYQKLNAKLEAARPGEKRWGLEWMPAADVDQRAATVAAAQATVAKNNLLLRKLAAQIAATQRLRDALPNAEGDNLTTKKRDAYEKQIDGYTADGEQAKKDIDDASKTIADTQPHWPDNLPADSLVLPAAPTP